MSKAKEKPLFSENTEVSVSKSLHEVMALLNRAGAVAINQELDNGRVTGVAFVIPYAGGRLPYRLPVRVEPVFQRLQERREPWTRDTRKQADREQAERVAWRHVFYWLRSQVALIETGMVEPAEVLLPYMLGGDGRTFFDTYSNKLLPAPEGKGSGV